MATHGAATFEINVGLVRAVWAGVDWSILTSILKSYIRFARERVRQDYDNNLLGLEPRPACTTTQLSAALDRIGGIDLLHKIGAAARALQFGALNRGGVPLNGRSRASTLLNLSFVE